MTPYSDIIILSAIFGYIAILFESSFDIFASILVSKAGTLKF